MMTFEPRSKSYKAKMYTEVIGENVPGRENSKLQGPKGGKTNLFFQFSYQMKMSPYVISRVCRMVFSFHKFLWKTLFSKSNKNIWILRKRKTFIFL